MWIGFILLKTGTKSRILRKL